MLNLCGKLEAMMDSELRSGSFTSRLMVTAPKVMKRYQILSSGYNKGGTKNASEAMPANHPISNISPIGSGAKTRTNKKPAIP